MAKRKANVGRGAARNVRGRGARSGRGTVDSSSERLNQVSGWNIMHERGMVFKKSPETEKYITAIKNMGWNTFVQPPCPLVPAVVREFYTNLDPRAAVSYVQGIEVKYDSGKINEMYKINKIFIF